ncbi:ABC transporter ATP-binding protein [Arthrobacter sp. S2(2024)]|uniref:ABC transporter ATP-binding protein n=1 Tax=Arthrobacter sp. S2(2024) TaxID=3111911 RepID=UPI002FC6BF96
MSKPLLQIENLLLAVGDKKILQGINLTIGAGEAVGVVGESGSGKSMTARSVIRLLPSTANLHGDIVFDGESVLQMNAGRLRAYRGSRVAMIFQDPRAHTNPIHTIGDFLTESVIQLRGTNRKDATARATGLLREVGITDPERRMNQFPHELSGGLLQRVMIAAALMTDPELLLADEPTTALDVTTQEEVMAIIDGLRQNRGLAMMFITHDLDLAAATCDRLVVMQAGQIIEEIAADDVYEHAQAAYTKELMAARLDFGAAVSTDIKKDWP